MTTVADHLDNAGFSTIAKSSLLVFLVHVVHDTQIWAFKGTTKMK